MNSDFLAKVSYPPSYGNLTGRPLTGRQIQVLREMASGRTYREIAGLLALSPHTVRRHMEQIYKKLGVQSKTQAVNFGKERKLFS